MNLNGFTDKNLLRRGIFFLIVFFSSNSLFAQSNWKKENQDAFNANDSIPVWRKGAVAISHRYKTPFNSKLFVSDKYTNKLSSIAVFNLNEPIKDKKDSSFISLEKDTLSSHSSIVANHFANFESNKIFNKNNTAEFSFIRGSVDSLGYKDGGRLLKSSVLKLNAVFDNNGRNYENDQFDILNLNVGTGNKAGGKGKIENFFGIRLEDISGLNANMINKGWGVYIKPDKLNNFFGGNVGIGTDTATHKLTIVAASKALKIKGLAADSSSNAALMINDKGEVSLSKIKYEDIVGIRNGLWNKSNSDENVYSDTAKMWRSGNVTISSSFKNSTSNKLMVTDYYNGRGNKGIYTSLNEPNWGDLKNSKIGLATDSTEFHTVFVANNYANFQSGKRFTDVHNSTAEFNFFRGFPDSLGFKDGGTLDKIAIVKIASANLKNGRPYRAKEYDMLNMRLFTADSINNPAVIDNFYAIRLEDYRGTNPGIIKKGWGIYMKPTLLNNHFGGSVGIGTDNVTHKLTIEAKEKPLKISGLNGRDSTAKDFLTINEIGEVSKRSLKQIFNNNQPFKVNTGTLPVVLDDNFDIYIHRGGDVDFILPSAVDRAGKSWRIVNIGTGIIKLNCYFMQGRDTRKIIEPIAGSHSFLLFSDGVDYISLE